MIVRSSGEVPRATLLERIHLPNNFSLPAGSRVERGR
jgi:hypothetical protein